VVCGDTNHGGEEANRFAEILKGKTVAVNALTKETVDIKSTITVNPKSATLFEIK
jgi:hypothetical protein